MQADILKPWPAVRSSVLNYGLQMRTIIIIFALLI
jgi:predicted component of type VI protein secretion system